MFDTCLAHEPNMQCTPLDFLFFSISINLIHLNPRRLKRMSSTYLYDFGFDHVNTTHFVHGSHRVQGLLDDVMPNTTSMILSPPPSPPQGLEGADSGPYAPGLEFEEDSTDE